MTSFISGLGYNVPDLIKFKVKAFNDQGPADLSDYNTGTVYSQTPPTGKPTLSATSTETSVSLTWS